MSKAGPSVTFTAEITKRLSTLATGNDGCRQIYPHGIPVRYRHHTFSEFPEALVRSALAFLACESDTLMLLGQAGSGKTTFAATLLLAWRWCHPAMLPEWRNGIFLPAYRAAEVYREMNPGDEEERSGWVDTPLLVLDDVGANRSTPHLTEQLLFLIERRYDWRLQTVVTTNLTLAEFAEAVDPRASSRLQEGFVLDLGDRDRRAPVP